MSRLPAEEMYDYLDVAERQMSEGGLWLARQILGALEDISIEEGLELPQRYYSLIKEYHSRAADKLIEEFLATNHI